MSVCLSVYLSLNSLIGRHRMPHYSQIQQKMSSSQNTFFFHIKTPFFKFYFSDNTHTMSKTVILYLLAKE